MVEDRVEDVLTNDIVLVHDASGEKVDGVEGHDNLSQQGSKRPNPDRLAPTSLPTLEGSPEPREVARATGRESRS